MAFASRANLLNNPVVGSMISANLLTPNNYFSFYFTRTPGDGTGGTMKLGGMDSTKIASGSSLNWIPLTSAYYWSVLFNSIRIGATTITRGTRAIFDTGSSLIFGPTSSINTIHTIIGATFYGNGLFTVNCNNVGSMPLVTIRLNGVNYTLGSPNYILQIGGLCFSGFSPLDITNNEGQISWVLGTAFLSAYYSVFDMPNQRVGIARSI